MIKEFIIPFRLDGLNEYTKANRTSAAVGAAMKRKNEAFVLDAIRDAGLMGVHFEEPVKLFFRWCEQNRHRDLDNIAFAKKFILDALVKAEVLKNDNWTWVQGFTDPFSVVKNIEPCVHVTITTINHFMEKDLEFRIKNYKGISNLLARKGKK